MKSISNKVTGGHPGKVIVGLGDVLNGSSLEGAVMPLTLWKDVCV